jgi:hypothetical protein
MNDLALGKKLTDRSFLQPITIILIAHPDHSNLRPLSKHTDVLQLIGIGLLFWHDEQVVGIGSQSAPNETHR